MKIYEAIKADHEIQRNLCSKLLETVGDSDERKELWKELRKELEVHEVAEERHFYKPLIDTDKMQEDARHGMAEHHEIDELIEKLEELDMSSSQWKITMEELSHKVDHHLEDEEKDFFKKSKDIFSKHDEDKLANDYKKTVEEYRKSWPESIPGND